MPGQTRPGFSPPSALEPILGPKGLLEGLTGSHLCLAGHRTGHGAGQGQGGVQTGVLCVQTGVLRVCHLRGASAGRVMSVQGLLHHEPHTGGPKTIETSPLAALGLL